MVKLINLKEILVCVFNASESHIYLNEMVSGKWMTSYRLMILHILMAVFLLSFIGKSLNPVYGHEKKARLISKVKLFS